MLEMDELLKRVDGLVHEKTQRGPAGLELTLKAVLRLQGGGALDFGGSEYQEAETAEIAPTKGADDKYGWWSLEAGVYRLRFNESLRLEGGERALLSPHPRLLAAGGNHPSAMFGAGEELFVMLQVFAGGLRLKENCRISRLSVLPSLS